MSQIPDELGALLARARQDGPDAARLARVRARLESQIGPLDAPRPVASPTLAPKVALGVVAVLLLLAIGAWLAQRSAPDDARAELAIAASEGTGGDGRERPAVPAAAQPAVGAEADRVAGAEPDRVAGAEAGRVAGAEADRVAGAEADRVAGEDAPPVDARSEPAVAAPSAATDRAEPRRTAGRASVAPIEASASDPASTLREEIALLDRALRAREAGDLARAGAALDEHRARFPSGTLSPERDRMVAELEQARAASSERTMTP